MKDDNLRTVSIKRMQQVDGETNLPEGGEKEVDILWASDWGQARHLRIDDADR